jgi:uncharacterized protein (DUF2132 family)
MRSKGSDDPLHGITLKMMLTELVDTYGWDEMSAKIKINCFSLDPSINSSLKFLRKTPWARQKVENLYLRVKWVESTQKPSNHW